MTSPEVHPDPTSDQAIIRDFSCSSCGKRVAYVELYPPGVPRSRERGEEHPGRRLDSHWSYQSNGDRYGDSELTPAQYEAQVESLAGSGAGDFVRLRCSDCGLIYCWDHADVHYVGDPERTMAKLPCGHSCVIDA
jgi:ribosomal protein S27E